MMNCLHWHCLLLLLLHCSIPQIAQFAFAVKQKQITKNIPSMPIDCKEFSVENSTENIQFPFPSPAEIIVPFSHSLFAPLHVRIQFPSNDENRTFVHVKNDRILCEYEARLEFKAFQQMPRPRQSIHNGIATDQNDVLSNETAVKLQTGNDGEHFVRFGCSNFVQPGFYRVLLLLKRNDSIEVVHIKF